MILGLDFETFGEVDLPKYGLDNYVSHPSFRPLIASIAYRDSLSNIRVERFDFVKNGQADIARLQQRLSGNYIAAHNASFERAVLASMGLFFPTASFVDTAVIARAMGAGSKPEAAAPQLLGVDKMEDGLRLIKKFSIPQADGRVLVEEQDEWTGDDWNDWATFADYCDLDAKLSFDIAQQYKAELPKLEWRFEATTQRMNEVGWFVDLDLVKRMQQQYQENLVNVERAFRVQYDPDEKLNFRSTPQLRAWCKERGVNAKSFDELNTAKLLARVRARIEKLEASSKFDEHKVENYLAVAAMLRTKQELGGSSLSKLETIQNLVSRDGRLRNQYLHVGAGQSFRTSGRGVQMQNLKRLPAIPGDVEGELEDWSNDDLARNLRQVFKAEHPDGQLVVGDFASVESRGLAWLAAAHWKLDAYRAGKDMYKVLASSMYGVPYESVDKSQRQTGKVGELSCGYGAGGGAVSRFAEKMGMALTEDEATVIVRDWRDANPEVVEFWAKLDDMLHQVVEHKRPETSVCVGPAGGFTLVVAAAETPQSLRDQMPGAQTVSVTLFDETGSRFMTRFFQGCFMEGRGVCYHKPSELKSGKLWLDRWTKDGQSGRYKVYGGKLAGILTQSFCRELFFRALIRLESRLAGATNAKIVGQFHDEIVVEWTPAEGPGAILLEDLTREMERIMSDPGTGPLSTFPMAADVKHAHRYIK